jgi:hypothetical protein
LINNVNKTLGLEATASPPVFSFPGKVAESVGTERWLV